MMGFDKQPGARPARHPLWLALLLAGACAGGAAHAQEAAAPTAAKPRTPAKADAVALGALTVTATRHATAIDQTPLAISAVTASTLADTGATQVGDIAAMVPGMSVQNAGAGQSRISLRGIYAAGEATTGIYLDDTPIAGSVGSTNDAGGHQPDLDLFDIDRVEVLRGPQGTLYGASSMGGAIRLITNKPDTGGVASSVQADYAVTAGGGPSWFANAMFNLPLVQDKLALRVVAQRQASGGYIDNVMLARRHVGAARADAGRVMLRYQPTAALTLDASFSDRLGNAQPNFWTPYPKRWALAPLYPASLPARYGSRVATLLPYRDHARIASLGLQWQLDGATLSASSAYQDRDSRYNQDSTSLFQNAKYLLGSMGLGSVFNADQYIPSYLYYPGHTGSWTNELRLSSQGGDRWDWTVGLYGERRDNSLFSEQMHADPASGGQLPGSTPFFRRHIRDVLTQRAAYGEATWHATDKLNVTGGLRRYDYTKTITGYTDINFAFPLIGGPTLPPATARASQQGWLKKLNLAYNLSPHTMLYALAADGMRPGGANQLINLPVNLATYRSDSLWNYELGIKTHWLDHRLYLSADAYQIDWRDMQVNATTRDGTSLFITNAGAARIHGVEWELQYRPLPGLELTTNANRIEAVLTRDQLSNDYESTATLGRAGDHVPYTPKFTATVAADYRWPIHAGLKGMARLDASHVGTAWSTFRPDDPSRTSMGNYTLVNARLGLEDGASGWSAYLYLRNAFNKLALVATAIQPYYAPYGKGYSVAPRTFGIDVQYHY